MSVAWRTLFRSPFVFMGLTFVDLLLASAVEFLMPYYPARKFVNQIVVSFFFALFQGAISYAAFQSLRGSAASIMESFLRGMSRIASLLAAYFLSMIMIAAGIIAFIIPGLMLFCLTYAALPACAVERLGPIKSISRSAELTKGFRWQVFGIVIIAGIISVATIFIIPDADKAASVLARDVLLMLPVSYCNLLAPVSYYSMRAAKENVAIEDLANVFD